MDNSIQAHYTWSVENNHFKIIFYIYLLLKKLINKIYFLIKKINLFFKKGFLFLILSRIQFPEVAKKNIVLFVNYIKFIGY